MAIYLIFGNSPGFDAYPELQKKKQNRWGMKHLVVYII